MLNKRYAHRLEAMLIAAVCILLLLLGRMAYLQLFQGEFYETKADGNRLRRTKVIAPRGLFFDKDGEILVNNLPGYGVVMRRQNGPYEEEVLNLLSEIIDVPVETIRKKLEANKDRFEPTMLRANITPAMLTKIEEKKAQLPGVMLVIQPIRNYLFDDLAVHTIGYVGEVSDYDIESGNYKDMQPGTIVGKFGIEKSYDKLVRGKDGSFDEEVDVAGNVVRQYAQESPEQGKSLKLTIDKDLQMALERIVDNHLAELRKSEFAPNARAAAVVAMEPDTGAIRALVSRPAFNPNLFVRGISQKDWNKINNDINHPMVNKVVSGAYPPGSTFKIITGAAALELEKVTPREKIFDSGKHWLVPMGNAGGAALGWIDFQEAFSRSNNVYFYEMGYRLGIDNIVEFAKKFGIGTKTGIELPGERSGLLPTPENKARIFPGERWMLGDTFNAAIGQGINLATPMQLATMVSCVANDGVYRKPHLVEEILNTDGTVYEEIAHDPGHNIGISEKTMKLVQKGMRGAASKGGTAAYFAQLPKKMAAKTGTSENPHGRDHGFFVAYGPAGRKDKPELVVACIVEQGGYGSVSAGPIVYQLYEEWFRQKGYLPPLPPEEKQEKEVKVIKH